MQTKNIARTGLLIALALILSYIESLIPAFVAVPGIKMGLANIVIVFALYKMGFKYALLISALRVLLSALLFGSVVSLAYSFAGAALSLLVMAGLKKTNFFGLVAVSVCGGITHNLAQIGVACLILSTNVIAYYIPVLLLSGIITGVVIGIAGSLVTSRVDLS